MLAAENLSIERGHRTLCKALSFVVNAGECLKIEGVNGAGKSSLLKCLTGQTRDFEGEVLFQGQSIHQHPAFFYSLCYLGHGRGLKKALTPKENLQWLHSLTGQSLNMSIVDALKTLEVHRYIDEPVSTLSQGQQQRVALARFLLSDALIWILDEPFTAVDVQGIEVIESLLKGFLEKGGAIVLTSHHEVSLPALKTLRLSH